MSNPAGEAHNELLRMDFDRRATVQFRGSVEIILGMDSSVSPIHGEREQSVWNGHFGCTYYHPLFVFNQFGDLERCALRPGNLHSADGWEQVLRPIVARYRGTVMHIAFRGDAAFSQPGVYEFLEAERIDCAIRLPANQVRQAEIAPLLKRPIGRPAHSVQRFHKRFRYQAASWSRQRRVVTKVEGTTASCSLASASSSRTCGMRPRTSWAFTTSGARASNGSTKAEARSNGRGSRAARLPPTR